MSETQVDVNKTRWSYSRTACFCHCKYEFYLKYIINDDNLYLSEGNYYAEVGSFVHEILAMIFEGKLSLDEALQFYIDNYDNYVCYTVKQSTMDKTFVLIADYFANLDLEWLKKYEILGVELEVNFKVNEYDFVGFIDLLLKDKTDNRIVILDHKSLEYPFKKNGETKKKCEKDFESYKRQMYLYCHSVYQKYQEFPKEITWNHFKSGGKFATIPFDENEYKETLKWAENIIKKTEKEIEFEASVDYFYCNNLCNFRNSCEYAKLK